jgi:fucose permease
MHAMHSLGGVFGAGAGALAARLDLAPPVHFLGAGAVTAVACLAVSPLLLPSRTDAEEPSQAASESSLGLLEWLRGWSAPVAVLGALAFCFTLAEGAALYWSAVYVGDALGGGATLGAISFGVFLGSVTLGRLAGDGLVSRFGAARVFRVGAIVAGVGSGVALFVGEALAGLLGLAALGVGIANALPLAISAGGNAPGEEPATAATRFSALAYLGSFVGPALIGGLATLWSLPLALAFPAALVLATAYWAEAVRRAG